MNTSPYYRVHMITNAGWFHLTGIYEKEENARAVAQREADSAGYNCAVVKHYYNNKPKPEVVGEWLKPRP